MFRLISAIILTVIISPIYISLLLFFVVYRKCIDLILTKKFGAKYGGLLDGGSALYAIDNEQSKTVVNLLLMVDCIAKNFYSTFKDHIKSRIFDCPKPLLKFTSVCQRAYGYSYLLKNEYGIDECIRELDEDVKDEHDLLKAITKYADDPLPKNHTALWEFLVCKNSIKWQNSNCYPVIFKFNHCLSDGVNLLNALATVLGDERCNTEEEPSPNYSLRTKLFELYLLIRLPSYLLFEHILKKRDSNSLLKKLSGERLFTWKFENEETVAKIKKIKNKIPQTTFMDVFLATVSASYEEYFSKSGRVPLDFSIEYVINFNTASTMANIAGRYRAPVLTNDFATATLRIPIRWNPKPLTEKLKEITRRQKIMFQNHTIKENYWMSHHLPKYIPAPILRLFKGLFRFTVLISNVTGTPYWTMCGGHVVREMIGWSIQFGVSGMTLILSTYGGKKMQLALSADKALFNSVDEMNEILNGITKYVNKLDQELNCNFDNYLKVT